jgi:hypothetical protein
MKRKFSLVIWGLALGYFCFYLPYCALIKVITSGWVFGGHRPSSGFELLPATVIATAITMPLIITMLGWWKYAGRRSFFGLSLPVPSRWTFLSGLCTAIIIATTTLAFTFSGVSIILTLVLLRAGVLILAPLVDWLFKRKVRWFSWTALGLSFVALGVALTDVGGFNLTAIAVLNVAAYVSGYLLRLPCMTKVAKSDDPNITRRYFVEEQMVAMPALVMIPALLALIGSGDIMMQLRHGFTTYFAHDLIAPSLLVGVLYAGLCVFGTLIYLDRRENTFCIPLNRCSSLLSGVAASYALTVWLGQPRPSGAQLVSAGLIVAAILFLSPLHHYELYLDKLATALERSRQLGFVKHMGELIPSRILLMVGNGSFSSKREKEVE